MAKSKDINDPDSVSAYIAKLNPDLAVVVESLRKVILGTDKRIGEQIKWNSPSFFYIGEMQPFDPKEYKRDIVVMNLHKGKILLVFPTGAKAEDTSGLLEGDFKDGRKIANFRDRNDLKLKEKNLQKVIRDWLKQIDK